MELVPVGVRFLHAERLRRMVRLRLDRELRGKVRDSEVVEAAYMEASRRLPQYLEEGDLPVFLWLRSVTGEVLPAGSTTDAGTVPSLVSELLKGTVTEEVGAVLAETLNVAVAPASVVIRPEVGVTVIPATSLSLLVAVTSATLAAVSAL